MTNKILVTGAAGQLGQAVVRHLLDTLKVEPSRLVVASRDTDKLAAHAKEGLEVRKADFDDPAHLADAFKGITRALIISTDALAVPGLRLKQHKTAIEAATAAGVGHLAYTSMPNPDRSLVTFAPDHLGTEQAIKACGVPYTIIRNAWYHDNYLMGMPHNLHAGKWYTSAGDGRIATIARDDCARAIAAVLVSDEQQNATYTLTGDQSRTATEIAAVFAQAVGKPLEVVQASDEQLAGGLKAAGLPDFLVDMLVSADANIRAGNFNLVTDDFHKLTGRQPQSLTDFVVAKKAAFLGAA